MKKCLCGREATYFSQGVKRLVLCDECKKVVYEELGRSLVPKGLESPYSPKKLYKM